MASINSLSSSTNSALGSLRGYGGLASGLDRDTLIEGMTSGTQAKINKQQKAKTTLQWQMDAYREISDKMIAFADKYTATMTSKTNLFSDTFWGAASTSVNGTNSNLVSVSGSSSTAKNVTITAIEKLAKNASVSNSSAVSDRFLRTGAIDTGSVKMSTLGGKSIDITIGDTSYTLSIPYGDGNLTDAQSVADAINKAAEEVEVSIGSKTFKLSEFVKAGTEGDTLTFEAVTSGGEIGKGNLLKISGGTALEQMGIEEDTEFKANEPFKVGADKLFVMQDFATRMGDKELTFNYNGTSKTINLPTKDEIKAAATTEEAQLNYVKEAMQKQLDTAFGKGRIEVALEDVKDAAGQDTGKKQLTFRTVNPGAKSDADKEDKSSTLSITDGSNALMGTNGGLGIAKGESNRVNLSASLKNSGLAGYTASADGSVQNYNININGKDIAFTDHDTVNDIMKKINESDAGVTISYMSMADKFVVTSKDDGTAGNITMSGTGAQLLFGSEDIDTSEENTDPKISVSAGQDAVAKVKYAGSDEEITLVRGSNTFDLEGLKVSLKGTFDASGNPSAQVSFTSNVDTEPIVTAISDMVKEYNEIVDLVNKQMSTRPDKEYYPLTSEQKSEMSEKEIELWEEKAKEGILYGSSELRSLSSDLRFTLNAYDQYNMSELGLSVSSNWADNGKLVLDESKLKAALETDIEGVKKAFISGFSDKGDGLAANLKSTMNKYVGLYGDTKGILIEKAGSTKSPTSVLDNEILSEMNDIDKILENLKARLSSEQDRYIKQFTQLETLISQMNAQSSYLSGLGF